MKTIDMDRMSDAIEYWQRGHQVIEDCLKVAAKGDWQDAPMPLMGQDARLWLQAQAEAYRHALEMMGIPEELPVAKPVPRPWVDDENTILKRLIAGDTIKFSQDGDMAWFTDGDKAFVGDAIMSLREKGYLSRRCDDEENYRGTGEYDTISDAGREYMAGNADAN